MWIDGAMHVLIDVTHVTDGRSRIQWSGRCLEVV